MIRLCLPAAFAALLLSACASGDTLPPPAPCRTHCSTHTDGYEWAQRGRLTDPRYCEGYTESFARGCRNGIEDLRQLRPSSEGL
ncbi:hypothetical protein [Sinimarinibacterium thermocellulolyticum]|uniref:Lipoprotein n=1 Tax=Sinimarinibacterium thermocellulolyticum TaxID=3170016 RepID=A0ABV2A5Q7_9GAMM